MKFPVFLTVCLLAVPASAETLRYALNWASGVNLGEAAITTNPRGTEPLDGVRTASATVDASLPGYQIRDEYKSRSVADFCSTELIKTVSRGSKNTKETVTFDQEAQQVKRKTEDGGGESEYRVAACAKDALTYLAYIRQELSQGRMPPHQEVVLGAAYRVELTYIGGEMIPFGDREVEADRVDAHIKGPASDYTVQLFFNRDRHRTPLLARLPLTLGDFTVELQR